MQKGGYWAKEWVDQDGNSGIDWAEATCEFPMDWTRHYFGVQSPIAADPTLRASLIVGRMAVISVHPPGGNDTAAASQYEVEMANGQHDDAVQHFIDDINALAIAGPGRLAWCWHHEPNVAEAPAQGAFSGAWDYLKAAFNDAGVTSYVTLLPIFTATQLDNGKVQPVWKDYFEGLGIDGYNWYGSTWHGSSNTWSPPSKVFKTVAKAQNALDTKCWLIESGCAEGPHVADKANWITDLKAMADEQGWETLGYFQSPPTSGDGRVFRIDSSDQALAAFKAAWEPE